MPPFRGGLKCVPRPLLAVSAAGGRQQVPSVSTADAASRPALPAHVLSLTMRVRQGLATSLTQGGSGDTLPPGPERLSATFHPLLLRTWARALLGS